MKVKVRYVGSAPAEILDTPFKFVAYGQLVEMPEPLYQAARANRVHLLTEEEFQSLGHTTEELKQHGRFETHGRTSDEFQSKLRQAWGICQGAQLGDSPDEVTENA